MKAKSTWMYFGLIQQGRSGPVDDEDRFGPREDWSQLWTDGVEEKMKVVKAAGTVWETTRDGTIRVLASKETPDVRVLSVDVYEQEIPPGSCSAKHWHMADEVAYVVSGEGESLQWEVEAEIAERYYARVAKRALDVAVHGRRHRLRAAEPRAPVRQHRRASRCVCWSRRTA